MYSWDRLSDQGLVCILLHLFPSVVGWLTSEAGRKKGSIQQLKDLKTSYEVKYCVTRVHSTYTLDQRRYTIDTRFTKKTW